MPSMSRSGAELPRRPVRPVRRRRRSEPGKFRVRDVALPGGLTDDRFGKRKDLRSLVDKLPRIAEKAAGDPVNALDEYYQQGYSLVSSPEAQKAFDVASEPKELRDRYGRTSFGQRALLARRLVEAGVPFITLYEGAGTTTPTCSTPAASGCRTSTPRSRPLIEDLDDRGMLDSTLICVLGEFGRTPKINKDAGRDHWSNAMSVLMAGAKIPGGQVIGATDRAGYSAVDRVLSPENFASSIYRKLGIDPDKMYYTPLGRPAHLVSDPTPISELFA